MQSPATSQSLLLSAGVLGRSGSVISSERLSRVKSEEVEETDTANRAKSKKMRIGKGMEVFGLPSFSFRSLTAYNSNDNQ